MTEVLRTTPADTASGQNLLTSVEPVELFALYAGGGTLSVSRYDDREAIARAVGHLPGRSDTRPYLVVSLSEDGEAPTPIDGVYLHQDDEVKLLDRAIVALTAAREACGRVAGGC